MTVHASIESTRFAEILVGLGEKLFIAYAPFLSNRLKLIVIN